MTVPDMGVTRFWWVRHAPVKAMMQGRIYGQRDVGCSLTETPQQQSLATRLPTDNILWVSSTLSRTKKTAKAIGAQRDETVRPIAYKELMEQNFGLWQGRTWDELQEEVPESAEFWQDPAHHCPPDGESFADVCVRVTRCINHLIKTHQGRDLICVAHAGTIRAALAYALDLRPARALGFGCDPYSLTQITHYQGAGEAQNWAVQQVNA